MDNIENMEQEAKADVGMACNMAFICALMAERDSADNENRCAACGEVIPEGIQICPTCGRK